MDRDAIDISVSRSGGIADLSTGFREILRAADLEKHVDPSVWRRWWEVNVKPVSDGRAVLKYLAPYVFRVAISDCSGCRL